MMYGFVWEEGVPKFNFYLHTVTQVIPRWRYVSKDCKLYILNEDRLVVLNLDFHNIRKKWNH